MTNRRLKGMVRSLAIIVFLICLYAFLLGNGVFDGKFENESIGWYFLAKGIFCCVSLFLTMDILEAIRRIKE